MEEARKTQLNHWLEDKDTAYLMDMLHFTDVAATTGTTW